MARTSNITFGQVAQIADTLKAAGTRPTARAIRERIGSGSMGTIHKLLQQWAGKAAPDDDDGEGPELPSSIASTLMDFVSTQVAEACEPLLDELRATKEETENLATENERLENVIEKLQTERDEAQRNQSVSAALHSNSEKALKESDKERSELRSRITELLRDLDKAQREIDAMTPYREDIISTRAALLICEQERNDATQHAAVQEAIASAQIALVLELRERIAEAEKYAKQQSEERLTANTHYHACAARLEAAAREIDNLKAKNIHAVKSSPRKPAAKKAVNGNS